MKIHVYPGDAGGCGYYRLIWPALAAKAQGHDIEVFLPQTENAQLRARMVMEDGQEVVVGVEPPDCDVIVMQRPLSAKLTQTIPFLQEAGKAVVVEIDDDFHAIDPRNGSWKNSNGKIDPQTSKNNLMRACQMADVVTVTTQALLNRYGCGHGVIIPNYVPERYLSVKPNRAPDGNIVIGWSGSVTTHPNDLQQMGAAVPNVLRQYPNTRFSVVGTGVGVHERVGLPADYDLQPTGWVEIEDYPQAMANIDVGLVPLDNTPFNQAKSWLKGLEFAALGVPFVASATDPYIGLRSQYGIGEWVAKRQKWTPALRRLVPEAWETGQAARQQVDRMDLIIERRVDEWVGAWSEALERRARDILGRRNIVASPH